MATVFILEAANLFAGDASPNSSNHLTLTELKMPAMEENYVDHLAGGAPVGIEINTHVNKPECTFNLAGHNPQVMSLFGSWTRENQRFTAYGGIRDRNTGKLYEAMCVMRGRLGRVNPTAFNRGGNMGHEYSIKGITSYKLTYAGKVMWDWDFFTNKFIVAGRDVNGEMNAILRIGGADAPPGGVEIGGSSVTGTSASGTTDSAFFSA